MKIPSFSSKKFKALLEKNGVYFERQGKTDHAIFVRETSQGKFAAPVQMGKNELDPHYIKLVLKQLGFSNDEIKKMFRK
jgi:predicted RNA binding protein YcfA (HicA-like mRNA interferase family)